MTKNNLPKIGKRYKVLKPWQGIEVGEIHTVSKVIDYPSAYALFKELYTHQFPLNREQDPFVDYFEELPPEKPTCDHPEIFKGPHGCTYGKCDGKAAQEDIYTKDCEEEKPLWKPASDYSNQPYAFQGFLGSKNSNDVLFGTLVGRNFDYGDQIKISADAKFCTLTDFINDHEKIKERVKRLEGKKI